MEFQARPSVQPPKNLYPCLAQITITPAGQGHETRQRRLSTGSASGGEDDGNALRRVISGNAGRRKSFGAGAGGPPAQDGDVSGRWYWRVQAGVNGQHLVLLPLSDPANPLLTQPPAPLSQAMPAHSTKSQSARGSVPGSDNTHTGGEESEGFTDKIKHLFTRRTSAAPTSSSSAPLPTTSTASDTTAVEGTQQEHVLDQSARGEQLATPGANAVGATNVNANAETGYPGVINGEKLGCVLVHLHGVEKGKVVLGGGHKQGGYFVEVPINSYFAGMIQGMIEPIGKAHHEYPKSGVIKFEFDNEWVGAKGEAELLHHYITQGLQNLPAQPEHQRHEPQAANFQLGGGNNDITGTAQQPLAPAVAPDQK